jgi:phosphonate utilization associated putative membrane protein
MTDATLALTVSVLMHVLWNTLVRQQAAERHTLWWALLAHCVLTAPWTLPRFFAEVSLTPTVCLAMAASAISNSIYFLCLRRAYAMAPVAFVYPVVRSAPLLIAIWGWLLLGEALNSVQWMGILLSIAGLQVMSGGPTQGADRKALPWAVTAMVCTSVYSISDKLGTQDLTSFTAILGFVSVGYATGLAALSLQLKRQTGHWIPQARPHLWVVASGGVCIGFAYALVTWVMKLMPVALAVAYSNAGIVLATLLSIVVFKERQAWRRRLAAACLICAGLYVLST